MHVAHLLPPAPRETAVDLADEPVESLVLCLSLIFGHVLAHSPLGRPVTQDESGRIRMAAREAVWATLASVTQAGADRVARFTPHDGFAHDWTAGIAWQIAASLAPGIDDPRVFEFIAEEFPGEAIEHLGLVDSGPQGGSLARCRRMAAAAAGPCSCA